MTTEEGGGSPPRHPSRRAGLAALGILCLVVGTMLGLLPESVPLHGAGSWSWVHDRQVSCGSPWAPDYGNVRQVPDGVSLCDSQFGSRGLLGALLVVLGFGLGVFAWLLSERPRFV